MKSNATSHSEKDDHLVPTKINERPQKIFVVQSFPLHHAAQILLIVLGSMTFLYFARAIVLPLLLAWIAAMTLKPLVNWLHKFRVPMALGSALVLAFFLILITAGISWLGQPAVKWIRSAPETLPQLKQKYQHVLQPITRFTAAISGNESQSTTNSPPAATQGNNNHFFGTMFDWTGSLLAGLATAIVLTFLLLLDGDRLIQKVAHFSPHHHKNRTIEISREIQHGISNYLFTVTIINICLGILVGTILWLLKMPNPAMWGGVATLLNFLPFFGPTIGVFMVGLAGLIAFDSVGKALLPVSAYLAVHLLESYLVTPFALGQRFSLNRAVIFMMFIFCAWLWGVVGALLAMPILVSVKVICERVPSFHPAAEFISA
jgi:predicted PurR-regulated permease PerM